MQHISQYSNKVCADRLVGGDGFYDVVEPAVHVVKVVDNASL